MSNIWGKEGSIANRFWKTGNVGFPIYDMHGHMGPRGPIYFRINEPETMVAHLKKAGVRRFTFSHYFPLFSPDCNNADVVEIAKRFPEHLRVYVVINPHCPKNISRDLELFDSWRPHAVGFKFLSSYHQAPLNDKRSDVVFEFANKRKLPVLIHTWGGDQYASIDMMIKRSQDYPDATLFAGHSYREDWDGIKRIEKESSGNVYYELTSIPGTNGLIEKLVDTVGSKKIVFGTDLPWFDEFQGIGGVIAAKISDDDIENILRRNVERILGTNW